MQSQIKLEEAHRWFPDECPKVESCPSLDDIISEYLKQHDVFIEPVSSNTQPTRATNALMGAVGGPMAAGMNQGLTTQAKSAALQEWTSWKQWALGQADFAAFKRQIINEHAVQAALVTQWVEENADRIELKRNQKNKILEQEQQFAKKALGGIFVALILIASIPAVSNVFETIQRGERIETSR